MEPSKGFVRLLENILKAGQWFLNGFQISTPVECQLKMTILAGNDSECSK
jgi:hypothetical protein